MSIVLMMTLIVDDAAQREVRGMEFQKVSRLFRRSWTFLSIYALNPLITALYFLLLLVF
jgi:hypothetical protein